MILKYIGYKILDGIYMLFIGVENIVANARKSLGQIVDYRRIDKQYNIDTQLISDSTYIPISTKVFNLIMKNIDDKNDLYFFDYGSGKGKALILAAEAGIKYVSGIELDKDLVELSEINLEKYRMHTNKDVHFNVIYGDATKWTEIDEYNLFFINNSFGGNPSEERMVAKILKNIEESLKRKKRQLYIIYVHPSISLQKLFNAYNWLSDKKVILNPYRPKMDKAYIYIINIK